MSAKASTEKVRNWTWNREETSSVCGCGAHMKRHRWFNPRTLKESAKARQLDFKPPPRLRGYKRCYLCAWRLWSEREGCSVLCIGDAELLHRANGADRCAV